MANLALTGQGRVFLNLDGAGCGNTYDFYNCMKVGAVDKSLGDITSIYCPDPTQYDEFIEVASIKGADSRWTSTLTGRLEINAKSPLETLLSPGCAFGMQVHYGRCTRPDSIDEFESAIIFQDVRLTNYGLSELVALTPDERAVIEETASISIGNIYRIFDMSVAEVNTGISDLDEIIGLTHADSASCGGDCDNRSDGCDVWVIAYALQTTNDIQYQITNDGGVTWTQVDANITETSDTPTVSGVIASGSNTYTVFFNSVDNATYVYREATANILSGNTVPTLIATIPGVQIWDIDASDSYIWLAGGSTAGTGTYIGAIHKSTNVLTEVDNNDLFTGVTLFHSIDARSDDRVVAIGIGGIFAYSTTFGVFNTGDNPDPVAVVFGRFVHMLNDTNWIAGWGDTLYCTSDSGDTWNVLRTIAGFGSVDFYDDTVGYFQDNNGLYRTIDSGNNWTQISTLGSIAQQDLVVCPTDPNKFLSVTGEATFLGSN